jgi:hypothetical protein
MARHHSRPYTVDHWTCQPSARWVSPSWYTAPMGRSCMHARARLVGSDSMSIQRPTEFTGLAWAMLLSSEMSISGRQLSSRGRKKTYQSQASSRLPPLLAPQIHCPSTRPARPARLQRHLQKSFSQSSEKSYSLRYNAPSTYESHRASSAMPNLGKAPPLHEVCSHRPFPIHRSPIWSKQKRRRRKQGKRGPLSMGTRRCSRSLKAS